MSDDDPVEEAIPDDDEKGFPGLPKRRVVELLHELEFKAYQGRRGGGLDFDKLSPEQIDKVLDLMKANEDNAFAFHTKRLDTAKDIELKRIQSRTINQRTLRYILIAGIVFFFVLTLLFLFYADQYLLEWLSFIAGLGGGYGLSKLPSGLLVDTSKNPIIDEDE